MELEPGFSTESPRVRRRTHQEPVPTEQHRETRAKDVHLIQVNSPSGSIPDEHIEVSSSGESESSEEIEEIEDTSSGADSSSEEGGEKKVVRVDSDAVLDTSKYVLPNHTPRRAPSTSVGTSGRGMEVATTAPSLQDAPDTNDDRVQYHKDKLRYQLQLERVISEFETAASSLRVAVNASADRVEPLINIQNCLFEILKICDATSLMMQSFISGASNILEKLRVAYLYILDGFPDFAKTDIEAISKDIKTMKKRGEQACNSVNGVMILISSAGTSTENDWKSNHKNESRGDTNLRHKLILLHLKMAGIRLESAAKKLSKTDQIAEQWYTECKEFVVPMMAKNFQAADKLPKEKQERFWTPLQFEKDALVYLCRWRALQDYCEQTRGLLRRTRRIVDGYYTENLYPKEAILFAWTLAKESPSKDERVVRLISEYEDTVYGSQGPKESARKWNEPESMIQEYNHRRPGDDADIRAVRRGQPRVVSDGPGDAGFREESSKCSRIASDGLGSPDALSSTRNERLCGKQTRVVADGPIVVERDVSGHRPATWAGNQRQLPYAEDMAIESQRSLTQERDNLPHGGRNPRSYDLTSVTARGTGQGRPLPIPGRNQGSHADGWDHAGGTMGLGASGSSFYAGGTDNRINAVERQSERDCEAWPPQSEKPEDNKKKRSWSLSNWKGRTTSTSDNIVPYNDKKVAVRRRPTDVTHHAHRGQGCCVIS